MSTVHAGIAIGASETTIEIRTSPAEVIWQETVITPRDYSQMVAAVGNLIERAKHHRTSSIVVGISGMIRDEAVWDTQFTDRNGKRLRYDLMQLSGVSTSVFSATALGAVGEYSMHSSTKLVYVDWGAYFAAASTRNNQNVQVRTEFVAHQIVNSTTEARRCHCGGHGHVDAQIAGRNLMARFNREASDLRPQDWDEIIRDLVVSLRHLIQQAGARLIVLDGSIADEMRETISVAGVQDAFRLWNDRQYVDVRVVDPLCGNPVLRGAVLTANRLLC